MLDAAERERYARHLLLPELGEAGQERLKAARVLLVGAGGLGSPAALYLAAAGVGSLTIVDHDRVEPSNLQRQVLYDTADVGAPKAEVAARRLRALNPAIRVEPHVLRLDAGNVLRLIEGHDLVVDGSDRLATRYLVADACVIGATPLVSAAIHRFEGQAFSYRPGTPCYRCLFPESARAAAPSCAEAGVLGVLPGILGSLQAAEAIKLLAGIGEPLLGRLLVLDALAMRWQEFRFGRRIDCAVCGAAPAIRSPASLTNLLPDSPACSPGNCSYASGSSRQQGTMCRWWTYAGPSSSRPGTCPARATCRCPSCPRGSPGWTTAGTWCSCAAAAPAACRPPRWRVPPACSRLPTWKAACWRGSPRSTRPW